MQTIEKALHQPMPFTTGGQTISDRLTAAKHSLAGSQLGKTICKATTEELMAPKKKHLDYLLHCTNEPNVSIPSMANMLIERTQNPNWTVVYKALITIHNIMCYGNERFSQYLASCNTTFNLGSFLDKNSTQGFQTGAYSSRDYWVHSVVGYDMSQHVRRYGKYIGEKIATYRVCAFDFCKVKRGREDGLLRTMHTDKLLKTLPILQNQIDALLEFQVSASELSNGVINCSFILLFRDLIRLFACYNDGVINLLEKYFEMNKKQAREALDMYKGFLTRLDKVSEFLRVAESVGIDRGEIPDLTRAPASLLEALESHLFHLEGGRGPPPVPQPPNQFGAQQMFQQMISSGGFVGSGAPASMADSERQKYIEMEKEKMRQFEEQRKQQQDQVGGSASTFNPFANNVPAQTVSPTAQQKKASEDLMDLFSAAPVQQAPPSLDPSNPFATAFSGPTVSAPQTMYPMSQLVGYQSVQQQPLVMMPTSSSTSQPSNGSFGADFSRAFGATSTTTATTSSASLLTGRDLSSGQNRLAGDVDTALSSLADNLSISGQNNVKPVQWGGAPGAAGAARPAPPTGYAPPQMGYSQAPPASYAGAPMYGMAGGYGGQPPYGQQQWAPMGMAQPGMYGMQQPGMYGMPPQQQQQPFIAGAYGAGAGQAQAQQNSDSNPFGNPFS